MDEVIKWLQAHPLINIRALERLCAIPQGALAKALKGNTAFLSEKHLPVLKSALKKYGL